MCIPYFSTSFTKLICHFSYYKHPSEYEITVTLICISLMANNVNNLSICFLAICSSFLKKISIQVLCPF